MPSHKAYRRSVLVTGGAGFIGSNFLRLVCQNEQYADTFFTCLDKLSYVSADSTKYIDPLMARDNFEFVRGDLSRDWDLLHHLIVDEERFTDIIHFAAESSVDRSFEDPLFFTRNNILGTQNLLECVRLLRRKNSKRVRFVHISTDEVYGEQESGQFANEETRLSPSNPYSATKASIDLIINAYWKSFDIGVVMVRSNNVYGYNQYPEKIVPMTIDRLTHDQPVIIHGDGHNLRRYLFIDDFVRAVVLIWEKAPVGEIYNVGSEDEVSNLELVRLLMGLYGKKGQIEFVADRAFNDERYNVNFDKIRALGWTQEVGLEDGLRRIIEH